MIYLKFMVTKSNESPSERVYCCKDYQVSRFDDHIRVDVGDTGIYETLSQAAWLNMFVISETGKTIDAIHAPKRMASDSDLLEKLKSGEWKMTLNSKGESVVWKGKPGEKVKRSDDEDMLTQQHIEWLERPIYAQ